MLGGFALRRELFVFSVSCCDLCGCFCVALDFEFLVVSLGL